MEPLLELKKVYFGYGAMPVLEDINIHIHHGQFAALVGPSGAGKTTLLKLILGSLQATDGEIYTRGKLLQNGHKPRVGYVPQLETVDWNFPVTVEHGIFLSLWSRLSGWGRSGTKTHCRG